MDDSLLQFVLSILLSQAGYYIGLNTYSRYIFLYIKLQVEKFRAVDK